MWSNRLCYFASHNTGVCDWVMSILERMVSNLKKNDLNEVVEKRVNNVLKESVINDPKTMKIKGALKQPKTLKSTWLDVVIANA